VKYPHNSCLIATFWVIRTCCLVHAATYRQRGRCVADDVEWNVPGGTAAHTAAKLVPYVGVYKSKAALLEQYLPVGCCSSSADMSSLRDA